MASEIRTLKIASGISRAISEIFSQDFGYSIPIADVRISKDLKYSDIFLYKDERIDVKELNKISGFLQHKLTKYVSLRYMPKLRFHATDTEVVSVITQINPSLEIIEDANKD